MIKATWILLLLFISVGTINAQDLDIDWGKEFDSKTEVQKILGYSGDVLVAYSIKGKKRFVGTYEKVGFKELSSGEFQLPELEGKKSGMLNLMVTGDHITAILYVYMKKTKSFSLYSQKISLKGKSEGKAEKIYASEGSADKIKGMKVKLKVSPGGNKAVVYFDRTNKERTEFYSDNIVLDIGDELTKVSTAKHQFKMRATKSEKIRYSLYHSIENDGSYNIIREKIDYMKSKISDFKLLVGRYDKDGKEIGVAEIKDDGKVLLAPTMVVKDDGVYVVGYFMNNPKNRSSIVGYSGLFLTKLKSDMSIESQKTTMFSDDFKKNLYSARRMAKMKEKGKELLVPAPYRMKDIYVHEDGTFTVLSEYYRVTTVSQKGSTTTTTNYGPILFFKLNADGEITSGDVIQKNQYSSTTSMGLGIIGGVSIFISIEFPDKMQKYWSYASTISDGKIYLVFNDHFKNSADGGDELSKRMVNPKKSVPFLVTINADGSFEKKSMVTSGDTETYTVPQVTYSNTGSEFIIWGVWRKMNKFGLATISK
jgi:hypothetical protein